MMVEGGAVQLDGDARQRPEKLDLDQTQKLELLLQVRQVVGRDIRGGRDEQGPSVSRLHALVSDRGLCYCYLALN